ncbi:hypothetical protein D1224_09335 [Henriciella barbarensis]|uniref:Uncharacterized protein n=1 Tax=Henriciella barbarensis TaxID=86342 RepID=A0A399R4R9_9PROT|nr:hypothetical protein [Henriciella barbarensis]RIJ24419.1 hypothetical protein D1224_09335 [Henriciella barbarensis]
MADSKTKPALIQQLDQLSRETRGLERLAEVIFNLTAANILVLLLSMFLTPFQYLMETSFLFPNFFVIATFAVPLSFMALYSLRGFERIKYVGRVRLEEISDELHWNQSLMDRRPAPLTPNSKADVEVRILLKRFSINEKLPFTAREGGETVYALVNIVAPLTAIALSIFTQP